MASHIIGGGIDGGNLSFGGSQGAGPSNQLPTSVTININFNGVPRDFVFNVNTNGNFTMSEGSQWQVASYIDFSDAENGGEAIVTDNGGTLIGIFLGLDHDTPAVVSRGIDGNGSGDFAPVTEEDIVLSWVWT